MAIVPLAAAPMYTIVNIGGIGGAVSEAFAINSSGIAAGSALDRTGRMHGFAYEKFTTSFESGTDVRGVNSGGEVVGTSGGYATVWRGGSAESLGSLGGSGSYGLGINDKGAVTGGALRCRRGQLSPL